MSKWCFNYDSGEYEDIDRDGYSYTQGEYVYNWDDSEYRREEECEKLLAEMIAEMKAEINAEEERLKTVPKAG